MMRTTLYLFACGMALFVPTWGHSQSADPPARGRVLLLQNERILEGEIEKVGDRYRLVRPGGGVTWITCDKAMHLCASREEAYQYLRKQANLDDPDEHVRLAKWCLMQELREQARIEIEAAAELRPDHRETQRLLDYFRTSTPQPAASALPAEPIPVTAPVKKGNPDALAGLELNAQCMGLFARRVQPILMNTCARCHASGQAGEFKLTYVPGNVAASGKSAQQNLVSVLSQIKPEQPLGSPLLLMAASAHGGATQPPLKSRQTAAYKALEQWVQLTAGHSAKVAEPAGPSAPAANEPTARGIFEKVESQSPAKEKDKPAAKPKETSFANEPRKAEEPADEFDPLIFNRQMHPEKK